MTLGEYIKPLLGTSIEVRSASDNKLLYKSGNGKELKDVVKELEVNLVKARIKVIGEELAKPVLEILVRDYELRKR